MYLKAFGGFLHHIYVLYWAKPTKCMLVWYINGKLFAVIQWKVYICGAMIEIRLFVEHHADSQYFNTFVCPWIMLRQMYAHLLFVRFDYPRLNSGPLWKSYNIINHIYFLLMKRFFTYCLCTLCALCSISVRAQSEGIKARIIIDDIERVAISVDYTDYPDI